jgi:hypothetical protein
MYIYVHVVLVLCAYIVALLFDLFKIIIKIICKYQNSIKVT